jgi:hypothetical protein
MSRSKYFPISTHFKVSTTATESTASKTVATTLTTGRVLNSVTAAVFFCLAVNVVNLVVDVGIVLHL